MSGVEVEALHAADGLALTHGDDGTTPGGHVCDPDGDCYDYGDIDGSVTRYHVVPACRHCSDLDGTGVGIAWPCPSIAALREGVS